MKTWLTKLDSMKRSSFLFTTVIVVVIVCVVILLRQYFNYFGKPYMMGDVINISEGWQYSVVQTNNHNTGRRSTEQITLGSMHGSLLLHGGETMTLFKPLDVDMSNAAILIRTNHQFVNVYLDDIPLHKDQIVSTQQNPGMALHYLLLPEDYLHKTLIIELTSPYELYAGRTNPILMGTIPSLEAYTLARSMRSLILMAMCLLLGFCTLTLTLMESLRGVIRPQNFMLGVFALIWALYYVCTEYIMFQFFSPVLMSNISLGLYFTFQVPLSLFFYFSFEHYKKWMLPAVILHGGFPMIALIMQITGVFDLPQLLNINNVLLAGFIYMTILSIMEACKMNRMMMMTAPFLLIAYVSMLYNFSVFYWRRGVVPYSYRDTYFFLILFVLLYNVQQFFNQYYGKIRKHELLTLQNRTAIYNYEQLKSHLDQVGSLRHEMKNHFNALQTFLRIGRLDEATAYLERYAKQTETIIDVVYHNNLLINTVVSKLAYVAKEQGIRIDLDLRAEPINIAAPDIFNLMSNIIDNALEICLSIPAQTNRFIHLTVSRKEPYLNIICENSLLGKKVSLDEPFSNNHINGNGYRFAIIKRIVDDYDGIMDTDFNESMFTIMIALKDL